MIERNQIHVGDCRDLLASWPSDCIDSVVTDPPYGLAFMGKGWDRGVPNCEFWQHALRVAKPGAHLLAFGGTRTYHRLACAIEDAGWQIRDCLGWIYGSGFPKSLDVSKAIDKAAGAEREVVRPSPHSAKRTAGTLATGNAKPSGYNKGGEGERNITAPATEAARQWAGWGTALKPAWEPIILARKPLIGTVAENVLEHGTGGLNVDGCRIKSDDVISAVSGKAILCGSSDGWDRPWKNDPEGLARRQKAADAAIEKANNLGRWPANIIHDGSDEVEALFPDAKGSKPGTKYNGSKFDGDIYNVATTSQKEFGYGDSGSASRFFYCAKASRSERGEGNHHPTVKPLALMRYLCRLITPPNGIVLDMFSGSGSTLVAACLERFAFAGCELSPEYAEIARRRVVAAQEIVARSQGKSVQQVLEL